MSKKLFFASSILSILLFISGCASKIMEGYIGKDVRMAVIDYGSPANAFDLGDGTRVFQWVMHKSYTTPTYVSSTGTATTTGSMYGNSYGYGNTRRYNANYNATTWLNTNTVISGGQTIHSKCIYTIFAKWSQSRKSWIITSYKKPSLMCE